MNGLQRALVLTLAAVLAVSALPVAAQDETGPVWPNVSELKGLEAGVRRGYYDFALAYPGLVESTPANTNEGIVYLEPLVVLRFDSDSNASDAFTTVQNELNEILNSTFVAENDVIEKRELEGVGEEGLAFEVVTKAEATDVYFRFQIAREDEYLFVVVSVALDAESNMQADSLLDYLVNEGEESADDVVFVEEGGSTGGLWGFFPGDDHEALQDLDSSGDTILFPVPEEEE